MARLLRTPLGDDPGAAKLIVQRQAQSRCQFAQRQHAGRGKMLAYPDIVITGSLDDDDRHAAPCEVGGGGKTRRPSPNDDHVDAVGLAQTN